MHVEGCGTVWKGVGCSLSVLQLAFHLRENLRFELILSFEDLGWVVDQQSDFQH
jgi:hypothetical protein